MSAGVDTLLDCKLRDLAEHPMLSGAGAIKPRTDERDTYVSFPPLGIGLVLGEDERVKAVHLHANGHEGYKGFRGEIPGGLDFGMSEEVRRRLGKPESQSAGEMIPGLGPYRRGQLSRTALPNSCRIRGQTGARNSNDHVESVR